MKLYIWTVSDTVVEFGLAIALAPNKDEAINAICNDFDGDVDATDQLRAELQAAEPDTETDATFGFFSDSPT